MHQKIIRLAVVHWFPLEQFPPAFNLLNTFAADSRFKVLCCTTSGGIAAEVNLDPGTRLARTPFPDRDASRLRRLFRFLSFPLLVFWKLLWFRPHAVLYFEPHSAPGVALYRLIRRCRVFIHYHEYREPGHLEARGNALARVGAALERQFLHHRAEWISHTNMQRIEMFLRDNNYVRPGQMRAMPNYPPPCWMGIPHRRTAQNSSSPLRLVYVGAVSLRDTWIAELLDWIDSQPPGTLCLDLYISTCDSETRTLLTARCGSSIRMFSPGVSYDQLPVLLQNYDVGLILYKGTTRNYVWNAPNKLFEYLTCGLEVWYPREMRGIPPALNELSVECGVDLDFSHLPPEPLKLRARVEAAPLLPNVNCVRAIEPMRQQLLLDVY